MSTQPPGDAQEHGDEAEGPTRSEGGGTETEWGRGSEGGGKDKWGRDTIQIVYSWPIRRCIPTICSIDAQRKGHHTTWQCKRHISKKHGLQQAHLCRAQKIILGYMLYIPLTIILLLGVSCLCKWLEVGNHNADGKTEVAEGVAAACPPLRDDHLMSQCGESPIPLNDTTNNSSSNLTQTVRNPARFLNIHAILFSTSIEHQPGPIAWKTFAALCPTVIRQWNETRLQTNMSKYFCLEVGNITNLMTHISEVAGTDADAFIFQEHSCPPQQWADATRKLRSMRRQTTLGILDPESRHNLGGLGVTTKHTRKAILVKPMSKRFQEASQTGRVVLYAVDIGNGSTLAVYNIYGWTGAHQNKKHSARTTKLIGAIEEEVHLQVEGPCIIAGDLNGDVADFKPLADMIKYGTWSDLGNMAHLWGRTRDEATCQAPNSDKPTRRDYIFANAHALQITADFQVMHQQHFPVHSFLRLYLAPPQETSTCQRSAKPDNLTQAFNSYCADNEDSNATEKDKSLARDLHLQRFHRNLDNALENSKHSFKSMLDHSDIDGCWSAWNDIVEKTFCDTFIKDKAAWCKYTGRGHLILKTHRHDKVKIREHEADVDSCRDKHYIMANKQYQRCSQWHARLRILTRPANQVTAATYSRLNADAAKYVERDLDRNDHFENQFADQLAYIDGSNPSHILKLKRLGSHLLGKRDRLHKESIQSQRQDKMDEYANDKHHRKAYKKIASDAAKPIIFLKRPEEGHLGQAAGTFATSPKELDSILTRAWQLIYNGTWKPLDQVVNNFMSKYEHLLFHDEEFSSEDIEAQAFQLSCCKASNTVGGLDGWEPIDFKLTSLFGFQNCGRYAECHRAWGSLATRHKTWSTGLPG